MDVNDRYPEAGDKIGSPCNPSSWLLGTPPSSDIHWCGKLRTTSRDQRVYVGDFAIPPSTNSAVARLL